MAEKKDFKVQAKVRDGRGKNDARRARREGMVPVTVMAVTRKLSPRSLRSGNWLRFCVPKRGATRFLRSKSMASAPVK